VGRSLPAGGFWRGSCGGTLTCVSGDFDQSSRTREGAVTWGAAKGFTGRKGLEKGNHNIGELKRVHHQSDSKIEENERGRGKPKSLSGGERELGGPRTCGRERGGIETMVMSKWKSPKRQGGENFGQEYNVGQRKLTGEESLRGRGNSKQGRVK